MKLLDDYIASSCILEEIDRRKNKHNEDEIIHCIFRNAVRSMSKLVIEHKKELPKEDVLFVLTCKTYKLKEYMEAHHNIFNDIQVILKESLKK